jgi:hypothetical protein
MIIDGEMILNTNIVVSCQHCYGLNCVPAQMLNSYGEALPKIALQNVTVFEHRVFKEMFRVK